MKLLQIFWTLAFAVAGGAAGGDDLPAPADAAAIPNEGERFPASPPQTLEEAWQEALAASPTLQAKRHLIESHQARARAARGAGYPQLDLGAGYTLRDQEPAFRFPINPLLPGVRSLPFAQQEAFGFETNLEIPVYTSGEISHSVAAAQADSAFAEQDELAAQAELKLRVAQAYVAVLRDEQAAIVATQRVDSLQAHWKDAERRFHAEHVVHNDLLSAEVALSNARQLVLQAEHQLDIHRAEYNRLLQRPLDESVQLTGLAQPPPLPEYDTFCHLAAHRRPELARLAAKSRSLDEQAEAKRATTRPQLHLLGQYAFEENRYRIPEGIAALTFGVHWDALDGGQTRHQSRALRQQAASVRKALVELRSQVELEVRTAWLHALEAQRRIVSTEAAVAQAEENLRAARNRHASGVDTQTKVLDAVLLRSEAGLNHHQAICDAVLAACHLRHATGDL